MLGDFLRVEPDAHGIVPGAEQANFTHSLDARQAIFDVEHRVVAQVGHVIAVIR